jgi:hypothetical protein
MRDAMTDDEFWAHVSQNFIPAWDDDDAGPDIDAAFNVGTCQTCGADGACGYDAEGRPMIHADNEEDDQ